MCQTIYDFVSVQHSERIISNMVVYNLRSSQHFRFSLGLLV